MPTMYVIFAGPQQHGRPGTRCIAKDGSKTEVKSKAAKFYIHIDALQFANQHKVELTELTHIGLEDFTDFEIQHDT